MQQLIARWRQAVAPTLKASTRKAYSWACEKWIEPAFGASALATISKADVQTFITDAASRLAPESVRDLRARLRGLLSTAEEWGWIRPGSNPAAGRLRMPPRRHVRPKRIILPEQFHALIGELPQPYSTVVILAVLAGLRKGELEALRWRDNRPGVLLVDESVYDGSDANGKYSREIGTPKTERSRREVAIGEMAQRSIDQWRSARWRSTGKPMARFTGPDDFMFSIRTNTPIDLKNALARHVKKACRKLGIPEVSWHDFRHTYATWGRLAGIKAEALRDQLGHSSVLMTLDVYSHAAQERAGDAAKIEEYASVKPKPPGPRPAKVLVFRKTG
jgi:integrase